MNYLELYKMSKLKPNAGIWNEGNLNQIVYVKFWLNFWGILIFRGI